MSHILDFLCAGWMWFALGVLTVAAYKIAPAASFAIVGGVVGFVIGRFWENARPAQYED